RITGIDNILKGCRNEDIALHFQGICTVGNALCARELLYRAGRLTMCYHILKVKAFFIVQPTLVFSKTYYNSTVLIEELSRMVTHIAKTLNHDFIVGLAEYEGGQRLGPPGRRHCGRIRANRFV